MVYPEVLKKRMDGDDLDHEATAPWGDFDYEESLKRPRVAEDDATDAEDPDIPAKRRRIEIPAPGSVTPGPRTSATEQIRRRIVAPGLPPQVWRKLKIFQGPDQPSQDCILAAWMVRRLTRNAQTGKYEHHVFGPEFSHVKEGDNFYFTDEVDTTSRMFTRSKHDMRRLTRCQHCHEHRLLCDDQIPCIPCQAAGHDELGCIAQSIEVNLLYATDGLEHRQRGTRPAPTNSLEGPTSAESSIEARTAQEPASAAQTATEVPEVAEAPVAGKTGKAGKAGKAARKSNTPLVNKLTVDKKGNPKRATKEYRKHEKDVEYHALADIKVLIEDLEAQGGAVTPEEVLTFFPGHHNKWPDVAMLFQSFNGGWSQLYLAAYINWARGLHDNRAFLPNSLGTGVRTPTKEEYRDRYANGALPVSQWIYPLRKRSGAKGDVRTPAAGEDTLLSDLADGVVNWPDTRWPKEKTNTNEGCRELTHAIRYAIANPDLELRLSDVPRLNEEFGWTRQLPKPLPSSQLFEATLDRLRTRLKNHHEDLKKLAAKGGDNYS